MWLYDAREQWRDPSKFLTTRPSDYFRPLANVFYGLEYLVFGLEPAGYYVVNVLLHAWNAFLVCVLARLLFGSRTAALAAGAVFAVMQRPSATVCWISAPVLLTTALVLPTLVAHLLLLRAEPGRRRGLWVATFLGVAACVLTKESGVVVGPLMIALELRERGWRSFLERATWLRYLPFVALAIAYALLQGSLADGAATARLGMGPLAALGNTFVNGTANYLLMFNPEQAWTRGLRGFGLGLVTALGLLALAGLGGRRRLVDGLFALGFTAVGFLLFTPFLAQSDVLTGRYSYLPCVGGAMSLGLALAGLASRAARLGPRTGAALVWVPLLVYLGLQVVGTDRYARTNWRFHDQGEASRLLVRFLESEVAPLADDPTVAGERWILLGAPVENLRHLRCQVALFGGLPFEAADEQRLDLEAPDVRAGLAADGPAWLLERFGAERLFLWVDDVGPRPWRADRDPGGALFEKALSRNWRTQGRPTADARIDWIDLGGD